MENTNYDYESIEIVQMSKHLPIDIKPIIGRKWVLNGEDNSNFKMIKDAYDDSPTNASIINAYSNYILGEGLVDLTVLESKSETAEELKIKLAKLSVNKYLSKGDAKLIVQDFKTYGGYAVQVIWNAAIKKEDKKPLLIKHLPMNKIGINIDNKMNVTGYWFCFDWQEKTKYKPQFYPIFDGKYKDKDVEIYVVQRPSSNPFFAQPDWISGLRYAQLEGELANSAINHVLNGFQGTKVVNCNNGVPATEELKREYKSKILKDLTGTNNTNKVIVSFNASAEKGIVVTDIPIPELNQQYVHFAEEAEKKLKIAHSASPVLFSGSKEGSGLSNNADEIEMATAMTYRQTINPIRETILDGLHFIFKHIDSSIILDFLDFKTFAGDKREEVK